MAPYSAKQIAQYFLSLAEEDCGDTISNMKLQKLLYYAQGCYLAMKEQPLFGERIFAWDHGPVVADVYHAYKGHGAGAIPKPERVPRLKKDVKEILNEVYEVFGQFSAWRLRNMTHAETPWKNTQRGGIIKRDVMKKFFKEEYLEE